MKAAGDPRLQLVRAEGGARHCIGFVWLPGPPGFCAVSLWPYRGSAWVYAVGHWRDLADSAVRSHGLPRDMVREALRQLGAPLGGRPPKVKP